MFALSPAGLIPTREQWSYYFPGLMACVTVAMAAAFLSDQYQGPTMLFALLLGMAFNFSTQSNGPAVAGIEFASKKVLRFGIALLGLRISFAEIGNLGIATVALVVVTVLSTIAFGMLLARVFGFKDNFGVLTGSAVAICGASAAMAVSAVLRKGENHERDTLFTVVGVTALSTVAMILYPLVVGYFQLDDTIAGIFIGASIHDVAQVVGAGYTISEQTGDVATLVKLMRVAMLAPLVFIFALTLGEKTEEASGPPAMPMFLVAFIVLMLANNLLPIPAFIVEQLVVLSRWCLVTAIVAIGMKTSLGQLADVGGNAILLIVLQTLFLAALVLAASKYWLNI
jgi:uncharacterized integral membrane protein (TIGR00698 family)